MSRAIRMNALQIFMLFFTIRVLHAFTNTCDPAHLIQTGRQHNQTYFVFAITQDCQLIFARADQLNQFKGLAVDIRQHLTYCLPNLVQFHWQSKKPNGNLSLKMVFKRANNQICVLPVDFPRQSALVGSQIFRYSLLNSLTYAVCSYMPNSTFAMEPELSFMDSVYMDIIYFVDPKSAGSFWTIRQFKMDSSGYLKALETFVVKNFAEEPEFVSRTAGEYLLALDSQKVRLYSAHKLHKDVSSTCAYDLLFRPHKARINRHQPERNSPSSFRLSSYSADKNLTLFVESQRNTKNTGFQSRIFVADRHLNYSAKCLLELPYALKMELISSQSLDKLREKQLPNFESALNRSHHKHMPFRTSSRHATKLTTTTTSSSSRTSTTTQEVFTRPSIHSEGNEDDPDQADGNQINNEVIDESIIEEDETQTPTEATEERQQLTEEEMAGADNEIVHEDDAESTAENDRLQNDNNTETNSSNSNKLLKSLTFLILSFFFVSNCVF